VVAPVAQQYVAIDNDPEAIRRCREAAIDATVTQGDLCDPPIDARFHYVLCVGNTFSLLWDVDQAVLALKRWRLRLHRPDGVVVIDDLADDLWPELAEGRWCAGLDETEGRQLVWARDDAVFAVRDGEAVDLEQWHPTSADRRMRLWTAGSLRLVAAAAGYLPPLRLEAGGVLILRPTPPTPAD
jgi:SAM-dependent methyltransferase